MFNSKIRAQAASDYKIKGHIDYFDTRIVTGWIIDESDSTRDIQLRLMLGDRVLSRTIADIERPDVVQAGIGKLNCGFRIDIPQGIGLPGDTLKLVEATSSYDFNNKMLSFSKKISRRYIFDISDLIFYIYHHDNLSGIQRVVVLLIDALVDIASPGVEISFVFFDNQSQNFTSIKTSAVYHLLEQLKIPKEARTLKTGTGNINDILIPLNPTSFTYDSRVESTIIMLGAAWVFPEYFYAVNQLRRRGCSLCCLIHDLIPINMPTMCDKGTAEVFKFYMRRVANYADIICSVSDYTAKDIVKYLDEVGRNDRPVHVLQNGDPFIDYAVEINSASDKISGEYVLIVSTIEGRKNHYSVVEAWKKLREDLGSNLPTLVFIGRLGWRVERLMEELNENDMLSGKIVILEDVSDDELVSLYRGALFTIYPSLYEGWGLPVAESLTLGKVCLASNRTSVPEVARGCAILIDPENIDAIYDNARKLIIDRNYLRACEADIQSRFVPITWTQVAERLTAALEIPCIKKTNAVTPINKEITFRDIPYFDSGNGHGNAVAEHARVFSNPSIFLNKLNLDSYILADQILAGRGWYKREDWGRWTNSEESAYIEIQTEDSKNVIVYLVLLLPGGVANKPVDIVINRTRTVHKNLTQARTLIAIEVAGGKTELALKTTATHVEEHGPKRHFGVGVEGIYLAAADDSGTRLSILEKMILQMSHI